MSNATLLDDFFRSKAIQLDRSALFDRYLTPKPSSFDFDRVEGMLLGIAIGDALGITSEGMFP